MFVIFEWCEMTKEQLYISPKRREEELTEMMIVVIVVTIERYKETLDLS